MGSKLHWVEEVRLNSKLKHLMVVLHKAVHPQELTALPIDHRAGQNASTDGAVRAVCITCRGMAACHYSQAAVQGLDVQWAEMERNKKCS